MRSLLAKISTALTLILYCSNAFAQQTDQLKIKKLIQQNISKLGFSSNELKNYRISDIYTDKLSGATFVYLQQTYKDIDVFNSVQTVVFKNDQLMSIAGRRIDKIESKVNLKDAKASLAATDAVRAAARHLNLSVSAFLRQLKEMKESKEVLFDDLGISSAHIKSKLLWLINDTTKIATLCWQVAVQPKGISDYWLVNIDASNGRVVNKLNLNISCKWNKTTSTMEHTDNDFLQANVASQNGVEGINSAGYRVIPFPAESPIYSGGTPALVTNPWELAGTNNNATTLKWHDDGTTTYDSTRGNNVLAQEDRNNNNGFGKGANSSTASPALTFDFTPDFTKQPTISVNQNFALTNLFYWGNIMHDILYQYGFDEASGNFQANNLGRGGEENDYVFADAQDGGGFDNANFATPSDGFNPRMQMYLFHFTKDSVTVNQPASFKGNKVAVEGTFSSNNKLSDKGNLTGDVVLYNDDASGAGHSACIAAANASALAGKIALIRRGGCVFTSKVKNAQNAGAMGVIMMDTIPGEAPIIMSGSDNTITIPAVMISYETGDSMMKLLQQNTTVNVTLKGGLFRDGDLDNGVIAHEYTHGISNRLTGGPSQAGCLQNAEQMGEGWSDYLALMVTTDWSKAQPGDSSKARAIGAYAMGQDANGSGFRVHPYSTNMSINPWTYDLLATSTGGEPHNIGEIWCTVLWDMTWNIIRRDGINANIYNANGVGGNSVALKLVMEGMKLQKCSPGFVDGRDAILKADTLLYGGKYSCAIWQAFAKRGMGVNASEGSSDNYTDQVTDYHIPNAAVIITKASKDSAAQGETIQYTLQAKCQCAGISNYKIVDTLPSNITYVSGGSYNNAKRTVTFSGINLSAQDSTSRNFTATVNTGTYSAPVTHINETVQTSSLSSTWFAASSNGKDTWKASSSFKHSGSFSLYVNDSAATSTATLTTANAYSLSGNSTLSFWHYYNTEGGYDGGWIEISTDNGSTWNDLGFYIEQNGYQSNIATASGSKQGPAFSGYSGTFIQTVIDLSSFAGKTVKLRFNFSSDAGTGADGWYIDDILLTSAAGVYNLGQMFDSNAKLQSSSNANVIIRNAVLPVVWGDFTAIKQGNTALLKWQTLQELNTSKFVIERSDDGVHFVSIGTVAAAGNSSVVNNYEFIDHLPLNGSNYYRLYQADKDSKLNYTKVRMLSFVTDHLIGVTPNPAKDKIAVTVSGNHQPLKIKLLNAIGQQLKVYDMSGEYMQINLPHLAPGIYYIKIAGTNIASTHKLIIE